MATNHLSAGNNDSLIEPFLKYFKVSLAVAIIRNRPDGLTGKQFAERLCGQFTQSQVEWKKRADRLEHEILNLKQKLYHKEIADCIEENADAEDFAALIDNCSEFPPSSEAQQDEISQNLYQHSQFLRSIYILKSAALPNTIETRDFSNVANSTIKIALNDIMHGLTSRSLDDIISENIVDEVISTICRLIDCEFVIIKASIMDEVMSLTQRIIMSLITEDRLKVIRNKRILCHVIEGLAKSGKLRKDILMVLLSTVSECANMLRRSLEEDSQFLIEPYENLGFIFTLIGTILNLEKRMRGVQTRSMIQSHKTAKPWGCCPEINTDLCDNIKDNLDNDLVNLPSEYPLFAHSVWKVQGMLSDLCKTCE